MAAKAETLKLEVTPLPPKLRERKAIVLERQGQKWELLELIIRGTEVTSVRLVDAQYYRDLAEQAATKWLRRQGR